MQRGVLKLTNEETRELLSNLNLENYKGKPLFNKLSCLLEDPNSTKEFQVLLSEDEMEIIADEIGFVPQESNPLLYSAIQKVNQLITSVRN
jgi:hypothetical protein